jgi:hypothetical protein
MQSILSTTSEREILGLKKNSTVGGGGPFMNMSTNLGGGYLSSDNINNNNNQNSVTFSSIPNHHYIDSNIIHNQISSTLND